MASVKRKRAINKQWVVMKLKKVEDGYDENWYMCRSVYVKRTISDISFYCNTPVSVVL